MEMKKNLDEIERKNRKNESRETDRSLIQNRNIINEKIIKDMLRRLDEQEQISMEREDRIDKLENDNGLFRKNFGMKQVKRPKTTNLGKIS